tara:strand:- start:218 stop:406 length:189 start_codon:yes stop_codon:yes gene_type:complete
MATKKGMRRKTARRAYEPRRYAQISKTSLGVNSAIQVSTKSGGRIVLVPDWKKFLGFFTRVE